VTDSNGSREAIQTLLISSRLTRQEVEIEVSEGAEPSFSYSAAIESMRRSDDYTFAFVLMKIEQQFEGNSLVEFSTTYMTGFLGERFTSEDAEFGFLERLIEVAVWPRFRDLSQVMISQADLDFPILPAQPKSITRPKKKPDEKDPTGGLGDRGSG
jgi:hypothetical protein